MISPMDTKINNHKRKKITKLEFIKIKNSSKWVQNEENGKAKLLTRGKYSQNTCLRKYLYPEYINNSYNSIIRQTTQFKIDKKFGQTLHKRRCTNGQQACENVFNIMKMQIKTTWETTTSPLEWLKMTNNTKFCRQGRATETLTYCW